MDKEFEKKIINWLDKSGFPLEMRVAKIFQRYGFNCTQSDFYKDPETNEFREIDIIAGKAIHSSNYNIMVTVKFIIECKHSDGKPWLIFISENNSNIHHYTYPMYYWYSNEFEIPLLEIAEQKLFDNIFPSFHLNNKIGHGMTQCFSSGTDNAYKAINSVCKSATDELTRRHKESEEFNQKRYELVFPTIIVDNELIEYDLDENYSHKLIEVNEAKLAWSRNYYSPLSKGIIIIKEQCLEEYLKEVSKSIDWLFSYMKSKYI